MRLSEAQYQDLLAADRARGKTIPRPHKYHAMPTTVDGIRFASRREARRYRVLKILVRAGQISHLELQPRFPLGTDSAPVMLRSRRYPKGRRAAYFADFKYRDVWTGDWVIEDAKGIDTPVSRLKRAIVEVQYGIRIVLI